MSRTKIKFHLAGFHELMQNTELIAGRTKAVEEACNEQSSWGGYASSVNTDGIRARGVVWSYARQDGSGSTGRANRLIRNLGAE